jgi:hypothetical protein
MPIKRRWMFSNVSLSIVWPQSGVCANACSRCSSSLALIRSPGDLNEQSDRVWAKVPVGNQVAKEGLL